MKVVLKNHRSLVNRVFTVYGNKCTVLSHAIENTLTAWDFVDWLLENFPEMSSESMRDVKDPVSLYIRLLVSGHRPSFDRFVSHEIFDIILLLKSPDFYDVNHQKLVNILANYRIKDLSNLKNSINPLICTLNDNRHLMEAYKKDPVGQRRILRKNLGLDPGCPESSASIY